MDNVLIRVGDLAPDFELMNGMFAGVEPFNCSKRGTVVICKNGKVTYYHEQPMREARKVEDLAKAVSA
jgi:peroxiredoxin